MERNQTELFPSGQLGLFDALYFGRKEEEKKLSKSVFQGEIERKLRCHYKCVVYSSTKCEGLWVFPQDCLNSLKATNTVQSALNNFLQKNEIWHIQKCWLE